SGERDEPMRAHQLGHCRQLPLATDKAGQLFGQVAGMDVDRLERGKVRWQSVDVQLRDPYRCLEVLQPMQTQIADADPRRERWLDERACRIGEQHLSAMPSRGDACGTVDVETYVAVAAAPSLSRVQAHADPDRRSLLPLLPCKGTLRGNGCSQGIGRGGEGREERVALGADLGPCMVADRRSHDLRVPGEQTRVAV